MILEKLKKFNKLQKFIDYLNYRPRFGIYRQFIRNTQKAIYAVCKYIIKYRTNGNSPPIWPATKIEKHATNLCIKFLFNFTFHEVTLRIVTLMRLNTLLILKVTRIFCWPLEQSFLFLLF